MATLQEKSETTRQKVERLHKAHLDWSSETIANEIGVTKQLVHKIRKDLGLPTKMLREEVILYCKCCNKLIDKSYSSKVYCSDECRYFGNKIRLNCDNCQKELVQSRSSVNRLLSRGWKHIYCSRTCYYAGRKKTTREGKLESSLNFISPPMQL